MLNNVCTNTALLNYLQNPVWITETGGALVYVNTALCTLLQYEKHELLGKPQSFLFSGEEMPETEEPLQSLVPGLPPTIAHSLITKNRTIIPAETQFFPETGEENGRIVAVCRPDPGVVNMPHLLRKIFHASHVMMLIVDAKTDEIVDVNRQLEKVFEYRREELIGRTSRSFVQEIQQSRIDEIGLILAAKGYVHEYAMRVTTAAGTVREVLVSIDIIALDGKEYYLISLNDITQLHEIEMRLKQLFIQTNLIAEISVALNSTQDFCSTLKRVLTMAGTYTNVSRVYIFEDTENGGSTSNTYEWCNLGIEPVQKKRQNISYDQLPYWKETLDRKGSIVWGENNDVPEALQNYLVQQGVKSLLVFPLRIKERSAGFIGFEDCLESRIWAEEIMDMFRTISNVISSAMERKRILTELEEGRTLLQLTIESAKEGLWDWNIATGNVIYSKEWCLMLGYQPDEIESHVNGWEKIVHPEDKPEVEKALMAHFVGETDYYETIHRVKTKSGDWKWVLDHGKIVARNEKNEPLRALGTHIDVTRQKEFERELKLLNSTKDKFFSIISHDLKNPFSTLIGFAELLLLYFEDFSDEEKKEQINQIYKVAKSTHSLLESLLAWSRSQRGDLQLRMQEQPVSFAIQDAVAVIHATAEKKHIEIDDNVPGSIFAYYDFDSMATVFRNLLTNAIKFSNKNSVISINVEQTDTQTFVTVTDSGVGMGEEQLASLFKIDKQQSSDGTANEKGTGLGLILCKEFVEKNQGRISVESIPGKGTRFTVQLPRFGPEEK